MRFANPSSRPVGALNRQEIAKYSEYSAIILTTSARRNFPQKTFLRPHHFRTG